MRRRGRGWEHLCVGGHQREPPERPRLRLRGLRPVVRHLVLPAVAAALAQPAAAAAEPAAAAAQSFATQPRPAQPIAAESAFATQPAAVAGAAAAEPAAVAPSAAQPAAEPAAVTGTAASQPGAVTALAATRAAFACTRPALPAQPTLAAALALAALARPTLALAALTQPAAACPTHAYTLAAGALLWRQRRRRRSQRHGHTASHACEWRRRRR